MLPELAMCKTVKKIDIRPADPEKGCPGFSQAGTSSVVLGKWLMRDLKVLIIDEPTAGIDVKRQE